MSRLALGTEKWADAVARFGLVAPPAEVPSVSGPAPVPLSARVSAPVNSPTIPAQAQAAVPAPAPAPAPVPTPAVSAAPASASLVTSAPAVAQPEISTASLLVAFTLTPAPLCLAEALLRRP